MLRIVPAVDEIEMPDDLSIRMERTVTLAEVVQAHTNMKYMYDLGDSWLHEIEVEEVLKEQPISQPVCLEGEGTAPLEDCGGEPGFYEFLEVMKNPDDPEHKSMKTRATGQLYREFDMNLVNRRLRRLS